MTDIFFSYSSKDRERVRPMRDALAAQGFDVFWDQAVPAGVDWDTWIRQHLQRAKCAVVFWSANSVASDNVRHEATVAKQQGKLVPVLIEALSADQFPMGLYSVQGANLAGWSGAADAAEWRKFQDEIETRLTPLWVTAKLHTAEATALAEKARRDAAESRNRSLQAQLAKDAQAQHAAEHAYKESAEKLDVATAEIARLESRLLSVASDSFKSGKAEAAADARSMMANFQVSLDNVTKERNQAVGDVKTIRTQLERAQNEYMRLGASVKELTKERDALMKALAETPGRSATTKPEASKPAPQRKWVTGWAIPLAALLGIVSGTISYVPSLTDRFGFVGLLSQATASGITVLGLLGLALGALMFILFGLLLPNRDILTDIVLLAMGLTMIAFPWLTIWMIPFEGWWRLSYVVPAGGLIASIFVTWIIINDIRFR